MIEFESSFILPSDYVRLIGTEFDDFDDMPVKIEAGSIFVNASAINIQYVKFEDDPRNWDPLFQQFFEARLAEKLAYSVLQNATKAEEMRRLAKTQKDLATVANAKEGTTDRVTAEEWTNSRI